MRGLVVLRRLGVPAVYDGTRSVQLPGGDRAFIMPLARAAVAVGVDALFLEVHEAPELALSDAASMLAASKLPSLLREVAAIIGARGRG
jgi:2-dehydro-3-deoxyphosphooctonate aldolase (KDO 8-P synthase)